MLVFLFFPSDKERDDVTVQKEFYRPFFFLSTFPSVISADAGSWKFTLNSVHHRRKRLHAHIQSLPVSVQVHQVQQQRTACSDLLRNTCSLHVHAVSTLKDFVCTTKECQPFFLSLKPWRPEHINAPSAGNKLWTSGERRKRKN